MRIAIVCLAFRLTISALATESPNEAWPSLPKGELTIKNLGPRPGVKTAKTEQTEVSRGGKRVASITKVDRKGDGRFNEFMFTAFVADQRVIALSRIGGTNESAMFFSFDDVMIMTDVRVTGSDCVALLIMSKKHDWYEIFARQPDGYYWPADESQRAAVDAFFRKGAAAVAPLVGEINRRMDEAKKRK